MTPAALEANRRNAKKAGRPKGGMNADKLELSARCRVNDERHIKILEPGAQGGRPPFDPVIMFKILVIQATNNLSDERAEFLINDRLSFMRFLGLGLSDRIHDAWTIWLFREKLTNAGAIGPLFERFDATLRQSGYIAMSGQIVDASLIAAPRQRNSEDEKKAIKEGRIPDDWAGKLRLQHQTIAVPETHRRGIAPALNAAAGGKERRQAPFLRQKPTSKPINRPSAEHSR
jgi:transposase